MDEIDKSLKLYFEKWDTLVAARTDKEFFGELKPIAIGWKVADRAAYDKLYAELHDESDKTIET